LETIPQFIFFPHIQSDRTIHRQKDGRIRMVQKASGGGTVKSLKVKAAKASSLPGPQGKGLDQPWRRFALRQLTKLHRGSADSQSLLGGWSGSDACGLPAA
jgi:hypothetical protein